MSDEKNVANLYPYQDKNKYGQSNAEKSDEKVLDEERKSIEFKCSICNLAEICHYFGKCPPFARGQIEYVDDSFVMMDPFTPRDKGRPHFLTIGGICHKCNNQVCVECSIFYAHRLCRDCAFMNLEDLPNEIQAKLKQQQKQQ